MNLLLTTTIISVSANVILGVIVILKDYKSRTNQVFSIFCFSVAFWSIATYLSLYFSEKELVVFWVRMVMALATTQSVVVLLFVLTFQERVFAIKSKFLWIIVSAGVMTLILSLTPFVFSDILLSEEGIVQQTVAAPGIILFIIVTIGAIVLSIIISFKRYLKAVGIKKIQLKNIFLSLTLMYMGVIFFSFIQPVFFNNSNFVYLSSVFTLPFIILTSYSILRYRFMDIRVLVRKSIVYGFSLIIALGVFTYFVLTFKNTIEESWNLNTTWTAAILIIMVAVAFPPLKNLVEKLVNKIFKDKKSIDLAVAEVKEKLSHETDFDNLVHIIKKEINEYLQIDNIQLFVLDKVNNNFKGKNSEAGKSIPQKSDLIKYFEKYDDVLITEEIPHLQNERSGKFEIEMLQQANKEIKKYNFRLVMPVIADKEIIAVFGFSGTGKSFTIQDVEYLNKLREQIAFAIANALLYKETIDRIKK